VGKNVAVFVDVANIFYAAKAAGVDIDYVTLLKASSAGRDLVRAYAYTGLDPDNENQRNFHEFLRRHGYKVVSKDIRKYGDGKVKANLDIELVVDMMKTARNLDIAIVVSGDGDFAPAIRAVQEQGVRVEVVSFRGNTSSDLMDVADIFTDITQIAKVEKGSSRSGRRVADDDADLSMTEVPDKQSEGTGDRSRGRGRSRRTSTGTGTPTRGRSRVSADAGEAREPRAPRELREPRELHEAAEGPLVVLPGEKLSRAARPAAAASASDADLDADELFDGEPDADEAGDVREGNGELGDDGARRRRRRGGRGRGRGRGRDDAAPEEGRYAAAADRSTDRGDRSVADQPDEDDEEVAPRTTRRTASTFGSVWDSQIGVQATAPRAPIVDDEDDFDEPAIPEYLLTERRQRDANRGRGGGGRGRGGAYAAALDRERFGGGRGSTPSRFAEPAPRREGGFNRSDRDRGGRNDRDRSGPRDRQEFRQAPRPAPRGSGDEPWSEVPPEIEAMLRAQLGSRVSAEPRRTPAPERTTEASSASVESGPGEAAPAPRGRGRRSPSDAVAPTGTDAPSTEAGSTGSGSTEAEAPTPTPRTRATRSTGTRTRTTKAAADAPAADAADGDATGSAEAPAARTTRSRSTTGSTSTARTTTRRTKAASTTSSEPAESAPAADAAATEAAAPKRRTTRRKAEPAA
jgi:uncharacterized LabA/DUF88 family protein